MFGKNAKSLNNIRVTIKLRAEGIHPLNSWGPNSLALYTSKGFPVGVKWIREILIKMAKNRIIQLENQHLERKTVGVGRLDVATRRAGVTTLFFKYYGVPQYSYYEILSISINSLPNDKSLSWVPILTREKLHGHNLHFKHI